MEIIIISILILSPIVLLANSAVMPELRVSLLLWLGRDRQARKILEYLVEQNPERLNLYRKLGKIYYLENRNDRKALRIFEIILKLRIPFQWRDDILPLVARYYIQEGRKDSEALRLIEKAVSKELKKLSRPKKSSRTSTSITAS